MINNIKTYILYSKKELDRLENINLIKENIKGIEEVEAVFPKYINVPFLDKLISKSKERTGKALNANEIGCLLGHRKIWQAVLKREANEHEHFLIMESDSIINNYGILENTFSKYTKHYDLFFWGAWNGNVSIKRSTIIYKENNKTIGEPIIGSVYCTYGYSINKAGASYLLKQTRKIAWPVDTFRFIINTNNIKLGAISKELISTPIYLRSYIRNNSLVNSYKRQLITKILKIKHFIISTIS
jgi:GR25 family glycosyltransferase involved in LPS biosynthesis